jgi:two-component system response regulator FlrC
MTKRTNILLVDDDDGVREALSKALTFENYSVVPAANQEQALCEFQKQPIDVLLLDLNPPGESPWETVQQLISLQPSLPVIAMTARAEQQPLAFSNTQRVDVLMAKPLNLPVLIKTLDSLVTKS